jgi:NAD(P) transhydrogenase subunit alpha
MITGWAALYIFILAGFVGYEVISRVPVILHTPLMSGSNFVHGIVVVGAMVALGAAHTTPERIIGFFAVLLGAANAVGGYAVTERMLEMFRSSRDKDAKKPGGADAGGAPPAGAQTAGGEPPQAAGAAGKAGSDAR